jgi:meromycolic acid enoyl-[acyl-carrier protein] reductase
VLDLSGRRYLVTGVLTQESIAWAVASDLQQAGAEALLTGFGRSMRITERAAAALPKPAEVLELDVTEEAHFGRLADDLTRRFGSLDGVVHAIAAAPPETINGGFLHASQAAIERAFLISASSLHRLAVSLIPLLAAGSGGSVVGLSFDAARAWPSYDWMGVSKAGLEAVCRYLAMYLGPMAIRANVVAAGPVETVAGRGIDSFDAIASRFESEAPLGWDRRSADQITGPVLFLLSDLARGITGEVLHADGGLHAVGLGLAR